MGAVVAGAMPMLWRVVPAIYSFSSGSIASSTASSSSLGPANITQVITTAPASTNVTLPFTDSQHKSKTAAIAGGILGGLSSVGLLAGACWFFLVHGRRMISPPAPKQIRGWNGKIVIPTCSKHRHTRVKLAGPAVSRPELKESKMFYYELGDR